MSEIRFLIFTISLMITSLAFAQSAEEKNIQVFKNLFTQVSEKLDASKLDDVYTQNFILQSNHQMFDYPTYKKQQAAIFKTLKSLTVLKYDDIFASGDKVAARMTLKLVKKTGETHTFYVILIAQITGNKVSHIWEMTYPSWSDKLASGK